jgi:hypothetical protein
VTPRDTNEKNSRPGRYFNHFGRAALNYSNYKPARAEPSSSNTCHDERTRIRLYHGTCMMHPGSSTTRFRVRFVRFVYDPGYVTANVVPVTLGDSPGVRCGCTSWCPRSPAFAHSRPGDS